MIQSIRAVCVDQANSSQQGEGITLRGEIATQVSAGGIADAQLLDQSRIMKSALMQIPQRLGIVIQLLLIEGGRLLEQRSRISFCTRLRIQAGDALRERQAAG